MATARPASKPQRTGRSSRTAALYSLALVGTVGLSLAVWLRRSDPLAGEPALRLAYAAPGRCVMAYQVKVDEFFDNEGYGSFFNRSEEHSLSWLGLGLDASGEAHVRLLSDDVGVKAQRQPQRRPQSLVQRWTPDPSYVGPAAPDAACRDRSWDPLQDALALAFVRLPAHAVRRGESWRGHEVRGDGSTCSARDACCNLGACLDAEQQRDRSAPCVTRSWRSRWTEHAARPGQTFVRIESDWDDGRPGGQGARARRSVEFDLQRGRIQSAEIELSHPFLGVRREIRLDAIDGCDAAQVSTQVDSAQLRSGLARIDAAFEYKQRPGNPATN